MHNTVIGQVNLNSFCALYILMHGMWHGIAAVNFIMIFVVLDAAKNWSFFWLAWQVFLVKWCDIWVGE
jgi:hypothetical protein